MLHLVARGVADTCSNKWRDWSRRVASRCSQLPHAAAERTKSFLVYQLLVYRCGIVVMSLFLLQDSSSSLTGLA